MTMATMFSSWHINDQISTSRGSKICLLTNNEKGNKQIDFIPDQPVTAPFGYSSFDEFAQRKNFDIRCSPEMEEYFTQLNKWTLNYVANHSERLLKRKASTEQIQDMYKSPLNVKQGYAALLKAKVNTTGNNAIRFWDADGELTDEPTDWKTTKIIPQLRIRQLWLMGGNFGWVIEITDCQIFPRVMQCPFPRLLAEKQKSQTENGINNEEESGFTSEPECNNC